MQAAGHGHVDPVSSCGTVAGHIVRHVAGPFGWEVLPERAAQGDVHDLGAAADGQHREVTGAGLPKECELEDIASAAHRTQCRGGHRAVVHGIHVLAAGQEQPRGVFQQRCREMLRHERRPDDGKKPLRDQRAHIRRPDPGTIEAVPVAHHAAHHDATPAHLRRESGNEAQPGVS